MVRHRNVRPQAFELRLGYAANREQILHAPELSAFFPEVHDGFRGNSPIPGNSSSCDAVAAFKSMRLRGAFCCAKDKESPPKISASPKHTAIAARIRPLLVITNLPAEFAEAE